MKYVYTFNMNRENVYTNNPCIKYYNLDVINEIQVYVAVHDWDEVQNLTVLVTAAMLLA